MNRTKRSSLPAIAAFAGGSLVAACGPAVEQEPVETKFLELSNEQEVVQSAEEALTQDLSLWAEGRGWTLAEARAHYRAVDDVRRAAKKLHELRPSAFVGSAISGSPGTPGTLYIKGRADAELRAALLAEGNIRIEDNQPFSFDDLVNRHQRIVETLQGRGFKEIGVSSDIRNHGRLAVLLRREGSLPGKAAEVLAMLPPELRNDVDVSVQDEPLGHDESFSGGGMELRVDYINAAICTTGWSVRQQECTICDPPYLTGVVTAGHCPNNYDYVLHAGVGLHTEAFQEEQENWVGDMQWHTTNAVEDARWYASPTQTRLASSVLQTYEMTIGSPVCLFSPRQGARFCTPEIQAYPYTATMDGVTFTNLVQTDSDVSVGGDSGAGWSYNTTAIGIHKGDHGGGNVFTPVVYIEGFYGMWLEVITF